MNPAVLPGIATLRRRAAAFVYEGVLLFGLVMFTGLVYAGVLQQRHALHGRHGLQLTLTLVLALYFVWFWTHGGQTVAMKAWSIRVTTAGGAPLGVGRALARHVIAWLWFLPALLAASLAGLQSAVAVFGVLAAGVAGYAAFTRFNRKGNSCTTWCAVPACAMFGRSCNPRCRATVPRLPRVRHGRRHRRYRATLPPPEPKPLLRPSRQCESAPPVRPR